jgi:hypothetical protein
VPASNPGGLPDLLRSMRADHGAKMAHIQLKVPGRNEEGRPSYARSTFDPAESVQATQLVNPGNRTVAFQKHVNASSEIPKIVVQ